MIKLIKVALLGKSKYYLENSKKVERCLFCGSRYNGCCTIDGKD